MNIIDTLPKSNRYKSRGKDGYYTNKKLKCVQFYANDQQLRIIDEVRRRYTDGKIDDLSQKEAFMIILHERGQAMGML